MDFILASGNAHKAEEFSDLFGEEVSVSKAPEKLDVDETGDTFQENALLKAKAYYDKFQTPVMSDDSGLVVNALPNELGIYSARFAPEEETYVGKCTKLMEKLQGKEDRSAYFVCVLCFYISPEEVYFFEGRVNGVIGEKIKGNDGFGYDPVFEAEGLDGQTLAQNPEWKQKNSHRSKAVKHALRFFSERNCQTS
jgi:XTP/dITP diphosphohydrolase